MKKDIAAAVILVISIILGIGLFVLTWDILCFPSDADVYFLSTARSLPQLHYLSDMHKGSDNSHTVWLHGKEILFAILSLAQRWFADDVTLRPLMAIVISSFCSSAFLFFLIMRHYFGGRIGLVSYVLFISCIWPYVYILFPRHQVVGLFFFLCALYLLQKARARPYFGFFYLMSGVFLCCAFYSSPVMAMYIPYYAAGFICCQNIAWSGSGHVKTAIVSLIRPALFVALGSFICFCYVNYPDIIGNTKQYLYYIYLNTSRGHFYYNQPMLQGWIDGDVMSARGGWVWVFRYFTLIMPILFPLFLAAFFFLAFKCVKAGTWRLRFEILSVGVVASSTLLIAEVKRIAQYGANYFSAFIGVILLVAYALFLLEKDMAERKKASWVKAIFLGAGALVLLAHVIVNLCLFWGDVFPSRMAKNLIAKKIGSLANKKIYAYDRHPYNKLFVSQLPPETLKRLSYIKNIYQASGGYFLLPPVTTRSVYDFNTTYTDFDLDIYLNELVEKGNFKDYVVSSFKTAASSKIWSQEQQVLSYMSLGAGLIPDKDLEKGKAWILDGDKLQADREKNIPRQEFADAVFLGIRAIGMQRSLYAYLGFGFAVTEPTRFEGFKKRIYKIGDPSDALVAYIYRSADDGSCLLPLRPEHTSFPVKAKDITSDAGGETVSFRFKGPLTLSPGYYYISIYRNGKKSDKDFYRVFMDAMDNPDMRDVYILQLTASR